MMWRTFSLLMMRRTLWAKSGAGEAVKGPFEVLIAAEAPDGAVKIEVVAGADARGGGFAFFQAFEELEELCLFGLGEVVAGETEAFGFEDQADAVDLGDVVVFEEDDEHTAAGAGPNLGLLLEMLAFPAVWGQ